MIEAPGPKAILGPSQCHIDFHCLPQCRSGLTVTGVLSQTPVAVNQILVNEIKSNPVP